jgi:hypothetical protein
MLAGDRTSAIGPAATRDRVEQDAPGEAAPRDLEVVHRRQDRAALGLPVAQDVGQLLGAEEVEAGERLVQEEDVPPLRERPREEDPLLLAAREPPDLPVREVGNAQLLERASTRSRSARPSRWKRPSEG